MIVAFLLWITMSRHRHWRMMKTHRPPKGLSSPGPHLRPVLSLKSELHPASLISNIMSERRNITNWIWTTTSFSFLHFYYLARVIHSGSGTRNNSADLSTSAYTCTSNMSLIRNGIVSSASAYLLFPDSPEQASKQERTHFVRSSHPHQRYHHNSSLRYPISSS
jgi:hypothetical protein